MLLARILTPSDFGLVAMVLSVTGFATMFRDLGLATAAVQSATLDHEQVSTLFWLNAGFACALGLVTATLAPALGWFFREPRVGGICVVFGSLMIVEGLGIQHQALLRRRMRFGAIAATDVGSLAAGVLVALYFAWRGAGYWALVWMRVATEATRTVGLWALCDWRPSATFSPASVRPLLAFGGRLTMTRFLRYATRSADRLLIGRTFGSGTLGLYAKAAGWLVEPFQQATWPIARVAVPILSRLQDDTERYRRYFLAGVSLLAACGVPLAVYLFVDASAIIRLLLGDQWLAAIPIFRFLAPVALAILVRMGLQWSYVSLGRTARQLRWEVLTTVITVAAFVVGLERGAVGVAAAYSAASLLLLPFAAAYCCSGTPVRARDLLSPFVRPMVCAAIAGGAVEALIRSATIPGPWLVVVAHALLFGAAYAGAWAATPGGRREAAAMLRLRREIQMVRRSPT